MGAILGRITLDGRPVDERVFRRSFDGLRPARCARSDVLVETTAVFGHHDMGLEAPAQQPLQVGPLTLVADARLYEREDLASKLGVSARETSDAELILRAYSLWGADCLAQINGDFGFAIHDRSKGEVFLARDHIGARPLYWAQRGSEVLFATLLHGVIGFDDIQWSLNKKRVARYLCAPNDRRLETFFKGVEVVGPGHWVRLNAEGSVRQRWWDPTALQEDLSITPNAAIEELRLLTSRAVKSRLPTRAKVGSHFSGGLDSTLITVLAAQALKERGTNLVAAYAWCPPVNNTYPDMGKGDERRLIAAQCKALGIPARYGGASGKTFYSLTAQPMELQGLADLVDELPTISQAQSDGLGVMLSGWGGDEVFSSHGLGQLAWLLRKGHLLSILRVARRYGGGLRRPHKMAALIWRLSIVPMMPNAIYSRFNPFDDLYGDGAFPSSDMRRLHNQVDKASSIRLVADPKAYSEALLLSGHVSERMETWAAWSAAAGFEYRYPLTDRRLLEFLFKLPRGIRFGDGTSRYLPRHAFADLLPRGVKKDDIANEKRRKDSREEWLKMLAVDASNGRFNQECPWLDMSALLNAINQEPPKEKLEALKFFARIFVALRVYEMHVRQSKRLIT